jgi:hypothetical protein
MINRQLTQISLLIALLLLAVLAGPLGSRGAESISTTFKRLPTGPTATDAFRFVALGDTGTGEKPQIEIAQQMLEFNKQRPFDTALLLGDNIYRDGHPDDFNRKFEKPYADLLSRGIRFFAVLGNHDVVKGRESQLKYARFNMEGRPYYSFSRGIGLIEFFALDSTLVDTPQLQWLDKALANSNARWKIAYFHHAIYSSGKHHGSNMELRAHYEPIFIRNGVSVVLSGHDHIYERTWPQKGIQYFVSGAGGKLRKGDLQRDSKLTAAGNDRTNSFLFAEATRDELTFWAINPKGEAFDQVTLAEAGQARAAGKN